MASKETNDHLPITPSTKVAALIEHYPDLEEVLIAMAPPFKKLKNPILRRSIAKIASLKQAAAVGRIPVDELVNKLRAAVGQEPIAGDGVATTDDYFTSRPDWFDQATIVASIDERTDSKENTMALVRVLEKAAHLRPMEMVELITPFLPAPGIDTLKHKGYLVWSLQESPELIRTYVSKPVEPANSV